MQNKQKTEKQKVTKLQKEQKSTDQWLRDTFERVVILETLVSNQGNEDEKTKTYFSRFAKSIILFELISLALSVILLFK